MPKYLFAAETNGCVLEDGSEAIVNEANNALTNPQSHHLQPTPSPPFPSFLPSAKHNLPDACDQSTFWDC